MGAFKNRIYIYIYIYKMKNTYNLLEWIINLSITANSGFELAKGNIPLPTESERH